MIEEAETDSYETQNKICLHRRANGYDIICNPE